MSSNRKHLYADINHISTEEEEVNNLFSSEEEAISALYEQLFWNLNHLCPQTILNGMKYLIFSKSMRTQMAEIKDMEPYEVSIMNSNQLEKKVGEAVEEIKRSICTLLEDILL